MFLRSRSCHLPQRTACKQHPAQAGPPTRSNGSQIINRLATYCSSQGQQLRNAHPLDFITQAAAAAQFQSSSDFVDRQANLEQLKGSLQQQHQVHLCTKILKAHSGAVTSCVVRETPECKEIITASLDKSIATWRLAQVRSFARVEMITHGAIGWTARSLSGQQSVLRSSWEPRWSYNACHCQVLGNDLGNNPSGDFGPGMKHGLIIISSCLIAVSDLSACLRLQRISASSEFDTLSKICTPTKSLWSTMPNPHTSGYPRNQSAK